MFDKERAIQHLNKLLNHYNIKVVKWSTGSNGRAWFAKREVKIPYPTNIDRFCVCMHEIKHIIDGKWGNLYQREYACEMFALEQAKLLGFDANMYRERARRYIIMNIAKGYCRKLKLSKLEPEIKEFCNINFDDWVGKKVYVSGWGSDSYKGKPLDIQFIGL